MGGSDIVWCFYDTFYFIDVALRKAEIANIGNCKDELEENSPHLLISTSISFTKN